VRLFTKRAPVGLPGRMYGKVYGNGKFPTLLRCLFGRYARISYLRKDNPMRWKVTQEACCLICNGSVEMAKHILWECPSAQDVWGGSKIIFQKSPCVGENFMGVLEYLMGKCSVMELELVGVIASRIWRRWISGSVFCLIRK
jgi:hypothetical protein